MTRTSPLLALATLLVADVSAAQSAPPTPEQFALDASRGIAPQPPRAADTYRRARPLAAETFEGMLLCEVDVEGDSWDGRDPGGPVRRYMGRVELDAEVSLPARDDLFRFRGPNDTNRVVFAIAGVRLPTGSSLGVNLSDRDVLSSDPIGRIVLTYGGSLPMTGRTEHATIECRGTPADALEDTIAGLTSRVDTAIRALATASRADRTLVGFRDQDADETSALLAAYEIARVTGLVDPRFVSRRDRLLEHQAAFASARTALVADLVRGAPTVGATVALPGTTIELVVESVDCDVEDVIDLHAAIGLDVPMECAVKLLFRNDGAPTTLTWDLHVVDDVGETSEVTRFASLGDGGAVRARTTKLARGETRFVVPSPSRRAQLLRISRRRALEWVRLAP